MCLLPLRKINSEDLASSLGFPGGSVVKNPLVMQQTQETLVRFLGLEDPLKESMATTPDTAPSSRLPPDQQPARLVPFASLETQDKINLWDVYVSRGKLIIYSKSEQLSWATAIHE